MRICSSLLLLAALVAVSLSTKTIEESDKAKQAKVLELLDQYVSHMDKGRSEDQVLDLLDQYVMHVDKGADYSLEEYEKRDRRRVRRHASEVVSWTRTVQLHPTVTLSWRIFNDTDIEFLVEAATRGYVGVGFSPGGGMAGADIVLGWVDDSNGEIYLVDTLLKSDTTITSTHAFHPLILQYN
ncbi:hypothetical protein L9F63_013032, partial [Diploptera punctata]